MNPSNNLSVSNFNKISNSQAANFLKLFAGGESVTFQTFDDSKDKNYKLTKILHGRLDEHLHLLSSLNGQGAGVFFTVNETDFQGRSQKNITQVRAVFVDLDGAPIEPVLKAPLHPHVIVETSPKRFHAYWLIDGLSLEGFSAVQKELIQKFDADAAVHDLPRVMRLPGFFHQKGERYLARVIDQQEALPYKSSDFLDAFQIDLTKKGTPQSPQLGVLNDPILKEMNKRGMVKRPLSSKPGAWNILCPFVDAHTTGSQGTVYFEAHTNGYTTSGFKCQHSHCEGKGIKDLIEYLELEEEWDDPLPMNEELLPVASLREGDRAFFLEAWNGNGSYTVDRIGRGTLHIPALCLSIVGGIQPGPLGAYVHQATSGGDGDDGLLQRFQMLVWPDPPKAWENIDRLPDRKAKEEAFEVFRKIDSLNFLSNEENQIDRFCFSSEAQELFDAWRTSLEQRLCRGSLSPAVESHLAKYRSLMPSLALIFYLIDNISKESIVREIDTQSALLSIQWCDYLETHAQRLYSSGENPNLGAARALLKRIKCGDLSDGFTPRDVYYSKHWSKLDTAEKVADAINLLEDLGWVKTERIKTSGRPTSKIRIHPQLRRRR